MKTIKNLIILIVIALVSTTNVSATDGVKIISKTKNLQSGVTSNTNIYLTDTKVLLENKGGRDNGSFYFDSGKEEFGYIDHSKKEYYLFDKVAMNELKQQVKMMVMMMKQFAAQMPAEQKKKLEKLMNPDDGSSTKFESTGKKSKISKWNTTQYVGTNEGVKFTEMYIASFSSLSISKSDFKAMEIMIAYFKENLSEVIALLPAGGSFSQLGLDDSSPIFKEGIPIKTVSYKNGTAADENLVQSVSKQNIDESIFNIPAGYVRKQINMEQQMGR